MARFLFSPLHSTPYTKQLAKRPLNTKLRITGSYLDFVLNDYFLTGSYDVITMRLVCDNYQIHIPCLSYRSGNGVITEQTCMR